MSLIRDYISSRMNGPNMGSRSINSTQRYMTIQFITDATIVDRGFFATYTSAMGIVRLSYLVVYSFLQVPFPLAVRMAAGFPVGYGDVTVTMFPSSNMVITKTAYYLLSADIRTHTHDSDSIFSNRTKSRLFISLRWSIDNVADHRRVRYLQI